MSGDRECDEEQNDEHSQWRRVKHGDRAAVVLIQRWLSFCESTTHRYKYQRRSAASLHRMTFPVVSVLIINLRTSFHQQLFVNQNEFVTIDSTCIGLLVDLNVFILLYPLTSTLRPTYYVNLIMCINWNFFYIYWHLIKASSHSCDSFMCHHVGLVIKHVPEN